MPMNGKFIVLDGPDGCGKSTQVKLLGKYLEDNGYVVVEAYDPGGTNIGEQIRSLLKYDAKGKMDVHTETMLFMASRAQLVGEVINPALEKGEIVICDRFVSSTCAYQGAGGYSTKNVIELARFAIEQTWPDLTIILDLDIEKGRERTGHQRRQRTKNNHRDAGQNFLFPDVTADRFDSRTLEYHRKVRKGFLELVDYYPSKIVVLPVDNLTIEEVQDKIVEVLREQKILNAIDGNSQSG